MPRLRRLRWFCWGFLIFSAFFYGAAFTFLPPAFFVPLSVPLLPLVGLVIWALPATDRMPGSLMRWLFMAVTVALIAWPNYLAIALPGLPWITLTRVFIIPLTLIFLVYLSTSYTLRRHLKEVISENRLIVRFFLLFIVTQVLSLPFSHNPVDSFEKLVINQFYWTAIFFLACYIFRDPKVGIRWSWMLVGLTVYIAIIGVWEWRLGRIPWAGHIPSILRIQDDSVLRSLAGQSRMGMGPHRVQTTFAESLGCAEYLALAAPLAIHFMMASTRLWVRVLSAAILATIFFTIVNTGSRLGVVGFFAAALAYGGLWAIRRWQTDRKSLFGPAMTLAYPAAASLFLAGTFVSGRLHGLVWGYQNAAHSTEARIEQFNRGWPMVLTHPLGYGVAQSGQVLGFTNLAGEITIDTYTLRLALEYGILGLLAFYAMFITAIVFAIRTIMRTRDKDLEMLLPFSVALIGFIIIKTVYSSEANHAIPFAMLGAICALIARSRKSPESPPIPADLRR